MRKPSLKKNARRQPAKHDERNFRIWHSIRKLHCIWHSIRKPHCIWHSIRMPFKIWHSTCELFQFGCFSSFFSIFPFLFILLTTWEDPSTPDLIPSSESSLNQSTAFILTRTGMPPSSTAAARPSRSPRGSGARRRPCPASRTPGRPWGQAAAARHRAGSRALCGGGILLPTRAAGSGGGSWIPVYSQEYPTFFLQENNIHQVIHI